MNLKLFDYFTHGAEGMMGTDQISHFTNQDFEVDFSVNFDHRLRLLLLYYRNGSIHHQKRLVQLSTSTSFNFFRHLHPICCVTLFVCKISTFSENLDLSNIYSKHLLSHRETTQLLVVPC